MQLAFLYKKARKEGNIMKLGKKNAMETGTFMAYAWIYDFSQSVCA